MGLGLVVGAGRNSAKISVGGRLAERDANVKIWKRCRNAEEKTGERGGRQGRPKYRRAGEARLFRRPPPIRCFAAPPPLPHAEPRRGGAHRPPALSSDAIWSDDEYRPCPHPARPAFRLASQRPPSPLSTHRDNDQLWVSRRYASHWGLPIDEIVKG